MLGRIVIWAAVSSLALGQSACGSSDSGGGNGGNSGTGASSGSGGTGASSGSGGVGATGGSAGSGGAGATGGASGSGGTGGSSDVCGTSGGAAGAAGAGTKSCGGKGGAQCDIGEFCDFPGTCGAGDEIGQCKPAPVCGPTCTPACGCDGQAYRNACAANSRGFDTTNDKSCVPGNGGVGAPCFGDGDCQTGFKCCRDCGAIDCSQSCTQVGAGGQCPMLP